MIWYTGRAGWTYIQSRNFMTLALQNFRNPSPQLGILPNDYWAKSSKKISSRIISIYYHLKNYSNNYWADWANNFWKNLELFLVSNLGICSKLFPSTVDLWKLSTLNLQSCPKLSPNNTLSTFYTLAKLIAQHYFKAILTPRICDSCYYYSSVTKKPG